MNNAVVIGGQGMVGNATMKMLGITRYYDIKGFNVEADKVCDYRYVFLCLPTPAHAGNYDLSSIEEWLGRIKENYNDNVIVIRSTVSPGTCRDLSEKYGLPIAHIPEFLTESSWEKDIQQPDILVVGANDPKIREDLAGVLLSRYKGRKMIKTDTTTSEMIKSSINALYALKVVFANQVYDYCKEVDANYGVVKDAMYARKWIGKNHLTVWHKGGRGGGGKCLGKDLEAFAGQSELDLLEVANKLNKQYLSLNENPKV